jgi:metal-responsive CopG/Arc/MetJ family transcriptional regulator
LKILVYEVVRKNMTDKITVSVLLDPEVLEELKKLQKKYDVFSRSKLLREIIEEGLKTIHKVEAK